jgi:sugar lactone lactonase YvrE
MLMTHMVHLQGLGFPEGPVALTDGAIAFVDLLHQNVRRFADGTAEVIAALQGSPNGMRMGPDGCLYVTNNGGVAPRSLHETKVMDPQIGGRVQRVGLDGRVEDVVTQLPGAGPWRPNDLIFTPDGRIVFTDPQNWEEVSDWSVGGRIPGYGGGRLFLSALDQPATLLAEIYGFPNGLAFHPDGALLVGVSHYRRILRFPWFGDRLGEPQLWCQFEDGTAPDGMLWHGGRLYVAGSVGDKIAVVDLGGRQIDSIDTGPGSDPTNLCITDDRLWVTLGLPGQLISCTL